MYGSCGGESINLTEKDYPWYPGAFACIHCTEASAVVPVCLGYMETRSVLPSAKVSDHIYVSLQLLGQHLMLAVAITGPFIQFGGAFPGLDQLPPSSLLGQWLLLKPSMMKSLLC